jgi:ABC-type phosphate/phosphonate transport system substrate-binding protein
VVVNAVENRRADAGAAYENVFDVSYRSAPEKKKLMRVVGETEEIPNGIYVGRGNLPAEDIDRLQKAFLAMNTDPEGQAALKKPPHDRIEPADDRMFDSIRETARILDLDLTVFDQKKQ